MSELGRTLIIIGGIIILAGISVSFLSKFISLGRLPGDILIKKEDFTFYFPLTTSILVSIILSVIFYLWHQR